MARMLPRYDRSVPAFHPIADTIASGLRTLVLLGVLSAAASLPAAAVARWRRRAVPDWLGFLAGPLATVHALNLLFFVVLSVWIGVDALSGRRPAPAPGQLAIFALSFLVPNVPALAAWLYVRRRRPDDAPPHVVPGSGHP